MDSRQTKNLCITIDLEPDFAGLVSHTYESCDEERLEPFFKICEQYGVKLTVFVVGKMLDERHSIVERLQKTGAEFALHSYSHSLKNPNSQQEIEKGLAAFQRYFKCHPLGYRAPQGLINKEDLLRLHQAGFVYDSSVFPSFWPGIRYLKEPRTPGVSSYAPLFELPFATLPGCRIIISQSWLKLLGWSFWKPSLSLLPLPKVLVFDSHLHDFVLPRTAFSQLSTPWKFIFGRNAHRSLAMFSSFLKTMSEMGYQFSYMSEVYREIRKDV